MDELEKFRNGNLKVREKFDQFTYYFIIGIVSFLSVTFLPMIGTEVGLDWKLPNTTIGWIVYVTTKVITAGLNVLIFHSFMQQAKINVRNDPNYLEAKRLLNKVKLEVYNPRSPSQFNAKEYGNKGTTIFVSTIAATVALTQAILSYDVVSLLTYLFTIVMGLIFGVMQMFKAEIYWTEEYLDYAKKMTQEASEHECDN